MGILEGGDRSKERKRIGKGIEQNIGREGEGRKRKRIEEREQNRRWNR